MTGSYNPAIHICPWVFRLRSAPLHLIANENLTFRLNRKETSSRHFLSGKASPETIDVYSRCEGFLECEKSKVSFQY